MLILTRAMINLKSETNMAHKNKNVTVSVSWFSMCGPRIRWGPRAWPEVSQNYSSLRVCVCGVGDLNEYFHYFTRSVYLQWYNTVLIPLSETQSLFLKVFPILMKINFRNKFSHLLNNVYLELILFLILMCVIPVVFCTIVRGELNKDRPTLCYLIYYFTIYCSTCFEC